MTEGEFKFQTPGAVRTRFAPSPTGFLHIGSARTALFNYLFAKKNEGVFILRIENTDQERSKPEYEKDIMETLSWLGIEWDEGPILSLQNQKSKIKSQTERNETRRSKNKVLFSSQSELQQEMKQSLNDHQKYIGDYGPYRQSERREIYTKYLKTLLAEDRAYYCFCSEEEIEAQRQYQLSIGQPPHYSGKCSRLTKEETDKLFKEGKPAVIRFRTPVKKVQFNDLIKGEIEFDTTLLGDFVIAKNLSSPLYNFACVVDDFEMKISHVIRGEEHISNTPKQILLQEALNLPSPKYAHLPMILAPDRSKLSKRYGAVGISEFKKEGYLPEALVNFVAFLGWNPGGDREIYSMNSLIKEFSLSRIQKGGAVFNIKKLDFLNGFYIRQKSIDKLVELCLPYFLESNFIEKL